jgi:hypothetical protein
MKLLGVVGARPNFTKMAPVIRALTELGAEGWDGRAGERVAEDLLRS